MFVPSCTKTKEWIVPLAYLAFILTGSPNAFRYLMPPDFWDVSLHVRYFSPLVKIKTKIVIQSFNAPTDTHN